MIWILARNVWMEQFRNRLYHLIWVFGAVLVYASLLVAYMAVEQELKVLLDVGLAMIEMLALAAGVFTAANSILLEMEHKTIYLVLTRPVPRGSYLLGRFLGLQLSVASAALVMALFHIVLLLLRGWTWHGSYLLMLGGSLGKIFLVSALTILLSLISTSVVSALTMTGIVWALGHFTEELHLMARKAAGLQGPALRAVELLLPNLQVFNLRDSWPPEGILNPGAPAYAAGYLLLYSGACLALAYAMFRKREF